MGLWSRAEVTHLACAAAAALCITKVEAQAAAPPEDALSSKVMRLTRRTQWTQVAAIKIPFNTFHPQGMVKIGDNFYVSSVEVTRTPQKLSQPQDGHDYDTGAGIGHLFKIAADGKLIADLKLGEGAAYHPGGIDFDGHVIWAPVSEYRPHSRAIVYRIEPEAMTATEAFRFNDHLGGVTYDRRAGRLYALNWGSRDVYTWPAGFRRPAIRTQNPNQYIDFQDCHYVAGGRMLCSGLADYAPQQAGPPFKLGGIDLVDLKTGRSVWQVPFELRSPAGRLMTQNPFFVETTASGLRAYFMPDDSDSTLFVFETS